VEGKYMTEELLIRLEEAGNRIPELMKRFANNEAICVRLIKKFPSDQNYEKYVSEIRVADCKNAEQSVHTLKGVASNLGLTKISDLTQKIVDELRGECDMTKINGWTTELESAYAETIDIISAYM
jgi:HPt (histidine-containing phosphotransfer) domain-containing protein